MEGSGPQAEAGGGFEESKNDVRLGLRCLSQCDRRPENFQIGYVPAVA